MGLKELLALIKVASDATKVAKEAWERHQETMSSDDQNEVRLAMKELAMENDTLHDELQRRLRGD